MKTQLPCFALIFVASLCSAADSVDTLPVLTPADIVRDGQSLKNERNKIIVRFEVASVTTVPTISADGAIHQVFHLRPDAADAAFSAPISPEFVDQLKRIGIVDIAAHFTGKIVTLEGYVSGTATMLISSPTTWTYYVSINSFDNIKVSAAAGQE